jgi:hypothetical protein
VLAIGIGLAASATVVDALGLKEGDYIEGRASHFAPHLPLSLSENQRRLPVCCGHHLTPDGGSFGVLREILRSCLLVHYTFAIH